jgi:regulatory protein
MTGKVTALRVQKRNRDRVNVYLDGEFAFGAAAIVAARLHLGQALSDADIAQLRIQDDVERAHEYALNFLSYRPRSEFEVQRALRKKDISDDVSEAVVERLRAAGLVNDREFARYWVDNRLQFNPRGGRSLRHELRQKGISDSIIAEALQHLDEEAAARRVAAAAMRRFSGLDAADVRRKMGAYMARRGFSYDVIALLVEEVLQAIQEETSTDIESEERNDV